MSMVMRRSCPRRRDDGAAFAEADAGAVGAGAMGAKDHLVAVFEERARLAVRQLDRVLAARRDLEQAAAALVLRARAGAGAHEVADREIAAGAGVVRHHLRDGPVDGGKISDAQAEWLVAGFAHALGREKDFELDVDAALRLVGGAV